MADKRLPTIGDYGFDSYHEFVQKVPDDERKAILKELQERQDKIKNSMDIGEERLLDTGTGVIGRLSDEKYGLRQLTWSETIRLRIREFYSRLLGKSQPIEP